MDCPSESELSSFAMGDMSNEKISCVASHCEQCPDCQESLETLAVSSDTVLESIRRGMPNMPFIAEEPCLSLLERTTLEAESAVGSEAKVLSKDDQLGQYQV
ncbi:MAG: hypothetical protein AB8G99_15330, partial [Planctomycetaceae bacterium]